MKAKQIQVGDCYRAKVSGKLVIVQVDAICPKLSGGINLAPGRLRVSGRIYRVTNLSTGRKTTFRSAAKFRSEVVQLPATAGR